MIAVGLFLVVAAGAAAALVRSGDRGTHPRAAPAQPTVTAPAAPTPTAAPTATPTPTTTPTPTPTASPTAAPTATAPPGGSSLVVTGPPPVADLVAVGLLLICSGGLLTAGPAGPQRRAAYSDSRWTASSSTSSRLQNAKRTNGLPDATSS